VIALDVLYNFAFEFKIIGPDVEPEVCDKLMSHQTEVNRLLAKWTLVN
jgi:hypothetical protein